jgi:hypothetical protein
MRNVDLSIKFRPRVEGYRKEGPWDLVAVSPS